MENPQKAKADQNAPQNPFTTKEKWTSCEAQKK